MSTAERLPRTARTSHTPARLVAGQRLDRATFHAIYESMPLGTHSELIDGVVNMPSPVSPGHAKGSSIAMFWLTTYWRRTPGVEVLDKVSTALDDRTEVQPDALLRVLPKAGGRTRTEESYIDGPPELVVEVSRSSRYLDLGPKRLAYERAGVLEYVVRALEPDELIWHVRRDDRLEVVDPGEDGIYRSETFPGLWLDPMALLGDDLDGVATALDRGLASAEHAAFVACLAEARPKEG